MAKPKQNKRLPKNVEKLTNDEVMRSVFGKRAQEQLKKEATGEHKTVTDKDLESTE